MKTTFFIFLLFFLGLVASSCQKEKEALPTEGKTEVSMTDLASAMQWYQEHLIEQNATRSGVHHPLFEISTPIWEACIAGENDTCKTVETYLNILNRGLFLNPETAQAYEETGNERYLRMLTRLVVLTSKGSNEIIGFYMTIVPSKDYLEKTDFKSFINNSYTVRDKNLDGYVLYHQLDGTFINGWIYEQGKITMAIYGKVSDSSVQTRAGIMVCIPTYSQTCTDWYSSSGGDTYYTGTTCDAPVYNGSDCYSTGGSGGSGGTGGGGVGDFGGGSGGNLSLGDSITTLYEKKEGDKFLKENLPQTMRKQVGYTCVTSIMEYIDNKVYNGKESMDTYNLRYLQKHKILVFRDGVAIENIDSFVKDFFNTTDFVSYKDAIDKGNTVMTDVPSDIAGSIHNVTVVGYQRDGKIIYMNPEDGKLYTARESYFLKHYNIVITGIKNK